MTEQQTTSVSIKPSTADNIAGYHHEHRREFNNRSEAIDDAIEKARKYEQLTSDADENNQI